MDDSLDEIWSWFTERKGQLVQITKEEDSDKDKAELRIEEVALVPHKDRDEYLSSQAFLLSGKGQVLGDHGSAPLPYDFYEVPLTDCWSFETSGMALKLKTERATYIIKATNGG